MYRDHFDSSYDEERYQREQEILEREREHQQEEERIRERHEREEHERRLEEAQQEDAWMRAQAEDQAMEHAMISDISNILIKKTAQLTQEEFVAWISGLYLKHGQTLFFEGLSLSEILCSLDSWVLMVGDSGNDTLFKLFNPKTLDMSCFEDEDDYKKGS